MNEYVYYFKIYSGGNHLKTLVITPEQLRTGEYSYDVEKAFAYFPEFRVIIKKRIKELKGKREAVFSLPGDPVVKVSYYRDEPPWPYGHPEGPETATVSGESIPFAKGATFVLVSDSFRDISTELRMPPKDAWVGYRAEQLVAEVAGRGYEIGIDYFAPAEGAADMPAKISAAAEEVIRDEDKRFARIVVVAHGGAEVRFPPTKKQTEREDDEEPREFQDYGPGITGEAIDAATVLGAVAPYIKPGGFLYIAACRQWISSWQFKVEEQGLNYNVITVPGKGKCLVPKDSNAWWNAVRDIFFP